MTGKRLSDGRLVGDWHGMGAFCPDHADTFQAHWNRMDSLNEYTIRRGYVCWENARCGITDCPAAAPDIVERRPRPMGEISFEQRAAACQDQKELALMLKRLLNEMLRSIERVNYGISGQVSDILTGCILALDKIIK